MGFFEETILALNRAEVRYIVVGGLAVVLHGHPRLTVDLDLVVDLASEEARKTVDVLSGSGMVPVVPVNPRGFADPETRRGWIEDKGMQVLGFRHPQDDLRRVDLFVEDVGDFERLWDDSVMIPLGSTPVRVASLPDLMEMKRTAGRAQDLADIEALQALQGEPGDG